MLYLVVGKDYNMVKKETSSIVSLFSKKEKPSIEYHTAETITAKDLTYRAEGSSLFGGTTVYVIESLVNQYRDEVLPVLSKLAQSQNVFIFCEDDVNRETEKEFESNKGTVTVLKADPKEKSNPFLITDALLKKDKKNVWVLYRKEIDAGESAEALLGRFIWAIKTLVLVVKYPKESAGSLGIAPFVYSKTKSVSNNWKPGEPEKFYSDMLFGIKPGDEMEYHLEKLILNM